MMKTAILLLLVGMGISAGAQSSGAGDAVPQSRSAVAGTAPDSTPAPLKCGKYEEFEPAHSVGTANLMATAIPDRCVPIMHPVSERDWQQQHQDQKDTLQAIRDLLKNSVKQRMKIEELQERVKALEKAKP